MTKEMEDEIRKFKIKWKHHNLNVLIGFIFYISFISLLLYTVYTIVFYSGYSKFYCVLIECIMAYTAKYLYKTTLPSKERRLLYISESDELYTKISKMMELEIRNTINNIKQKGE